MYPELRFYGGPPRPLAEVAVLHHGEKRLLYAGNLFINLHGPGVNWNGSMVTLGPPAVATTEQRPAHGQEFKTVELLPGRYTLYAHYLEHTGYSTAYSAQADALGTTFDAQAGHRYRLVGVRLEGNAFGATLHDESTGEEWVLTRVIGR